MGGLRHYVTCAATVLLSASQAHSWGPANGNGTLGLKTLILSKSGRDLVIPRLVVDGFDSVWASSSTLPSNKTNEYQTVVVAHNQLNTAEQEQLRSYGRSSGARIVYLNPTVEQMKGVTATNSSGKYIVWDTSDAAKQIADILNTDTAYDATNTSALNPKGVTASGNSAAAFLRYSDTASPSSSGSIAAFVNTDGALEEMYFTFDAGAHEMNFSQPFTGRDDPNLTRYGTFTEANLALGTVWFVWGTRGIYLGNRRLYLHMQVDDWFINTELTNAVTDQEKNFRIDEADCNFVVETQKALTSMLPNGSDITFEMAFNGMGYAQYKNEEKGFGVGLTPCSEKIKNDVNWVSHTWSHKHLDWKEGWECKDQEDTCKETADRIRVELDWNVRLMKGEGVDPDSLTSFRGEASTPKGTMFADDPEGLAKRFSAKSLVPPEISGLVPKDYKVDKGKPKEYTKRIYGNPRNKVALAVLKSRGIKYVVGDDSRPELLSEKNNLPLVTNADRWGVAGITILNRHATNVDYGDSLPEHMVYNWDKYSLCVTGTSGTPCSEFVLTYENAMARDAKQWLAYLLWYQPFPFMFHQANFNKFDRNGASSSLIRDWSERVIVNLMKYYNKMPVLSRNMDTYGESQTERLERSNCGLKGAIQFADGKPAKIELSSNSKCVARVSFSSKSAAASPKEGDTETVGDDKTTAVAVDTSATLMLT
eukprot:comp24132_c0_seq1/m.43842 comp24132_c0_seq1/g.43842  ORF comp24132_c0_seq1/g.43842 comp24132_c0_seq1/m.43842 type:complete len:706 (-) comp24132_c0_seq1:459-2576(-)